MRLHVMRWAVLVLALAPPVYLFVAVQYSGLTYPFWDNTDLLRWIADLYEGRLDVTSLWAPHNHTRPLTLRVIYAFNARLTGWDIRSEFVYMYAAIYGGFALQLAILWRLTRRRVGMPFASGAVFLSIIYFSPAGHMNHWWSMMLQLNLANVLILFAIWHIARDPSGVTGNVLAASAGWLAAYTITNGLVAMLVLAVLAHAARPRFLRIDRWSVFWGINLVAVFGFYTHSLPPEGGDRPGPLDLFSYALVYLGAPLADLVYFPFRSNFDVPTATWFPLMFGIGVSALAAGLCVSARQRIRSAEPAALVLFGFGLFAIGSALATAWGRASFDPRLGIAQASESRYTIFASYLLYGLIFYAAALAAGATQVFVPRISRFTRGSSRAASGALVLVFVGAIALATTTYVRGTVSYEAARSFNVGLRAAYSLGPDARELDGYIHAFPERAEQVRGELLHLRIGPYRNVSKVDRALPESAPASPLRRTVQMIPATRVYQEFTTRFDRLVMVSVHIITAYPRPSGEAIDWTLFRVGRNSRQSIGSASVGLDGVRDWSRIVTGDLGRTAGQRYGLLLTVPTAPSEPLGLALFERKVTDPLIGPVVVNGQPSPRLALSLVVSNLVD